MALEVQHVDTYDFEIVEAFCRVDPHLTSRASRLTPEALVEMIASPAYQLLVARDHGGICATLTFVSYMAPRGMTARIDDVVADQTEGGQLASTVLLYEAIRCAEVAGASEIKLVSKPTLTVANRTYERLGFAGEGPGLYRRVVPP